MLVHLGSDDHVLESVPRDIDQRTGVSRHPQIDMWVPNTLDKIQRHRPSNSGQQSITMPMHRLLSARIIETSQHRVMVSHGVSASRAE